jgi:hypothetical protein
VINEPKKFEIPHYLKHFKRYHLTLSDISFNVSRIFAQECGFTRGQVSKHLFPLQTIQGVYNETTSFSKRFKNKEMFHFKCKWFPAITGVDPPPNKYLGYLMDHRWDARRLRPWS